VRLRIDLAHEKLLCACYRTRRDLSAQLFASAIRFLFDFRARRLQLPLALPDAFRLALGHDLVGSCVCLVKNPAGLLSRIIHNGRSFLLRVIEALLTALGAASPSAIFVCRSSIAFMTGGQMNLMVNQTNTIIAIVWPSRVMFMSTANSSSFLLTLF